MKEAQSAAFDEAERGIPWFMQLEPRLSDSVRKEVAKARTTLQRDKRPDSRDRIIASLSFGFWSQLLGRSHDELWRRATHRAFPKSTDRKVVSGLAESIRKTRNRVAHHNYMKAFDVPRAMDDVIELSSMLSPEFTDWMESRSWWRDVYSECPEIAVDTVVVAAKVAWDIYQEQGIYVCKPGRFFREVGHLAFYESGSIRRQVPKILKVYDDVPWTHEEAEKLTSSEDQLDQRLGRAIQWALTEEGVYAAQGWSCTDSSTLRTPLMSSLSEGPRWETGPRRTDM